MANILGDRYSRKAIMAGGVFLWAIFTLIGSFMSGRDEYKVSWIPLLTPLPYLVLLFIHLYSIFRTLKKNLAFQFNADLDPDSFFHFSVDPYPDPAPNQSHGNL
jgi:hypothetical protein